MIEEFKSGDAPVFLISLKAGGVGLTLTEADYVFVLDPWWNPAVEAQAVDRTHRIGQQRPVMVYRLVAEETIEQKVMELKARKAALFAQVVDGDGVMSGAIAADDVRALFENQVPGGGGDPADREGGGWNEGGGRGTTQVRQQGGVEVRCEGSDVGPVRVDDGTATSRPRSPATAEVTTTSATATRASGTHHRPSAFQALSIAIPIDR